MSNTVKLFLTIGLWALVSCSSKPKYKQTTLDLGNRGMRQLPDSVLKMHDLECLIVGNSFTMYPPLSALGADKRKISKNDNQLTELPQEITYLKHLRSFYIEANQLRELPSGFHELEALDTLDLSFNENFQLLKAMGELLEMRNLKYLNIIGVKADSASVARLKILLPKTKVITTLSEVDNEIIVP